MNAKPSIFSELKRRNVLRAGVLYAGAVWLLAQVITQLGPVFNAPAWIARWFLIAASIGFPFWIAFAWYFAITPQGLRRESDIAPGDAIGHSTARKLDFAIIAVLALAVVLLLTNQFVWRRGASNYANATDANAIAAALVKVPAKSVAVLPFENLSEDKGNAYFASGMQDVILAKLALIGDLKVISRTSTEKYASHPDDLKTIAKQLGVATILEGSVQKAGNQVLISVQLIDANTDAHLGAETYTRTLDNIFGVEGEVAQKVADALKAKLTPADTARVTAMPTQNPEAYDLYLRALALFNRANDQYALTGAEMPQAIDLLQQALAKDPNFALADAVLAQAQMDVYFFAGDRTDARLNAAKDAADRALALQPDLGAAHVALAIYWYWGFRDYAQAQAELALARKTLPHDVLIEELYAFIARRQEQWQQALDGLRQAQAHDPRNTVPATETGNTLALLRRYAEADQAYARAAELSLNPTLALGRQAWNTVIWKGDLAPLRDWLAALPPASEEHLNSGVYYFELAWLSRDYTAAAKAVQESDSPAWIPPVGYTVLPRRLCLAWAVAASGNAAKAAELYTDLHTEGIAAVRKRPGDWDRHLALGFAAAGLGFKDEALREARRAAELLPVSRDAFAGPEVLSYVARIDVRAGASDQAIALLQRLLAIPAGLWASPAMLRLDPVWDPLRGDPRFQALLKKYAANQPALIPAAASPGAGTGDTRG